MKRTLLSLAALALTFGNGPAIAAQPDPYQIFAHAREVWLAQQYPPFVSYTIVVTVSQGSTVKSNHYSATYDAMRDRVYVDAVSAEERQAPHTPTGINQWLEPKRQYTTLFRRHVGNAEESVDALGVPMLAPNYSFGVAPYVPQVASSTTDRSALVAEIRREFNDPMPAGRNDDLNAGSGPKEIGRVVSTLHSYTMTYAGIETVDGVDAYHLTLRPTHAPDRLRLREMWIDVQTFGTVRVVTQGNFADARIPWLVTFGLVGGAQYIVSEQALAPVGTGAHAYTSAMVAFDNITTAAQPQYLWKPVLQSKNVLTEPGTP